MNIQTALNKAYLNLKKNKIKSANLDCEILMSDVIKKDRSYIIMNQEKTLSKKDLDNFNYLIEKRKKGEPIAYLTGKKDFWKHEFKVSKDILIPRPDSELIVEHILEVTKNRSKLNVLDIGVGSGCLLLSVLKERPNFYGVGIDINQKCINICKKNTLNLNIFNKIKYFKTDVDNFNFGKYDLIISNPPYISKIGLQYLEKDVIDFEPKIALNGGLDGISVIRKVINKSSELIKKNGKFFLEIAFDQKNKVARLLEYKGFYINKILKDYSKNDRCIVCTKI
jgi:release factor glutamine methyltransferase|tara:strand:- start:1344 stop:2186 length:843 start_codon:yes stop_codon:yes gene_type:complete